MNYLKRKKKRSGIETKNVMIGYRISSLMLLVMVMI